MYIFVKMLKYVDLLSRFMFEKSMFVCLWFFVQLENFSLLGTSLILVKGCNFFLPLLGTHGH